jgi:hypothetical protein
MLPSQCVDGKCNFVVNVRYAEKEQSEMITFPDSFKLVQERALQINAPILISNIFELNKRD